jgi:hypothetical protein
VTLMAAGLILAYSLLTMLRTGDAGFDPTAGASPSRVR